MEKILELVWDLFLSKYLYVFGTVLSLWVVYKILTYSQEFYSTIQSWRKDAEKLNPSPFLEGQIFAQLTLPPLQASPEKTISSRHEIRHKDKDFLFIYKWLNENELIYMKKYSPKNRLAEFFNNIGTGRLPCLITKNHARFDTDHTYITGRYLKGGLTFQWLIALIFPVLTTTCLVYDFSMVQIGITLFFGVPMSFIFYRSVTSEPRNEMKEALELIIADNKFKKIT